MPHVHRHSQTVQMIENQPLNGWLNVLKSSRSYERLCKSEAPKVLDPRTHSMNFVVNTPK